MSDFTPGPLQYKNREVYVEETGTTVATLSLQSVETDGYLFAAAPDLYAALTKLLDHVERSYAPSDVVASGVAASMAALAKAEGA